MGNGWIDSTLVQYLLVVLGGGLGSGIRFLLYRHNITWTTWVELGTFTANVISCFVLGYMFHRLSNDTLHTNYYALFAVGLCGGLSTFSTLILEFYKYYTSGNLFHGFLYIVVSVAVGLLCLILGIRVSINAGSSF